MNMASSPHQNVQFLVFMLLNAFFTCTFLSVGSTTMNIETDKIALLQFKSRLEISSVSSLSSWDTNSSPCNWTGITCSSSNRVVELHLPRLGLKGSIDPHVGNLSFLQSLQLQNNQFFGSIPEEITNLLHLRVVNMSSNQLAGGLPFNFTAMAQLEILDLEANEITSQLPEEIGRLTKLQVLNLARNQLYGPIPASIGNMSSLVTMNLGTNFLRGSIPNQVSNLRNLEHLQLPVNNLSGLLPSNVFNMSSLVTMALGSNKLRGTLPDDIGDKLSNLLVFYICFNRFTGTIPSSIHNITKIKVIRMAHNSLHGVVPPGLERLRELSMYNIRSNRFVSVGENGLSFLASLTNSSHLKYLRIEDNQLEGLIPEAIGNLSKDLSILNMGRNRIYGNIPTSIANLNGLSLLNLSNNSLSGEIPPAIGKLENLQMLDLARNQLSGNIPTSLGNLPRLIQIDLSGNRLVGNIPTSFGSFVNLFSLDLSNNKLDGSIPIQTLTLPGLSKLLNLSNNLFSGFLPREIGSLENVAIIDVSNNHISGDIPPSISHCIRLEVLIMARNEFSGTIPRALGDLRGLRELDLSSNNLSGSIPNELQNITGLQVLNLSFNDLEGAVPKGGVFQNINSIYLEGNLKLCLYSSCMEGGSNRSKVIKVVVFTIVFSTLALCLIILGMLIYFKRRKSSITPSSSTELFKWQFETVSYDELRLATENFSEKNLIGKGSFGSVYKGNLKQGVPVAIKVLDINKTGSEKSFLSECEALRNVRHRNLVKLITSCSSIDFSNMEFRALIYELLIHGSLEEWIQGQRSHKSGIGLNILERVNIAIDIASAINYLHHDCKFPIVHCDLKPSNILLDVDMTAKVGDFGLARLLIESENTQSSTHFLKGSIGYLPPEYGYGVKPTKAGDVYSFGITLLELFTGKNPTDEYFTGELNLVKWVELCFQDDLMEVIDFKLSKLSVDLEYESQIINSEEQKECLIKIIEVALSCVVNSPTKRIDIKDALSKLKTAKDNIIGSPNKRVYMQSSKEFHC